MKWITCFASLLTLTLIFYTNCDAQPTMQLKIDSLSTINDTTCFVLNRYEDGEVQEYNWLFEQIGFVRQYAYEPIGIGFNPLYDHLFFIVKQIPQIGDQWEANMNGPANALVLGAMYITVPVGTYFSWQIEYRDQSTNELEGVFYFANQVGLLALRFGDSDQDSLALTSYNVAGNGIFPLAVGNEWNYDSFEPVAPKTANKLPIEYYLCQIYPNPFNPTTTISFDLPVRSLVKMDVFDIQGARVGVDLASTRSYPAGPNHILFDGTGLASGIYFLRLEAGDFTQTQKLVLMK